MKILVTGATGYIGGRLVWRLFESGHEVRVLVRSASRIAGRRWADVVDVRIGDLLDRSTLAGVFDGVDAAYYLVHSMESGMALADRERQAVENFSAMVGDLRRVIYLSALLPDCETISRHHRSRAEVGEYLRERHPTLEIQAGPIIGSGSASFEMIRYLTELLPITIAPAWTMNEVQPIAVRDVLHYLVAALAIEETGILQIGSQRMTFRSMMLEYARARRLKRLIFPLPIHERRLSIFWVGLTTPLTHRIATPLIDGVAGPALADTRRAMESFPEIRPLTYREAVDLALMRTFRGKTETRWTGALGSGPTFQLVRREGLLQEVRSILIPAPPRRVFEVFTSIGGEKGWMTWLWAWKLRGLMDRLIGGPGLRRGRRHPRELLPGETVDFWRVEIIEKDRLLRLRAEMKVPGDAWLQWESAPADEGTCLVQTAAFAPRGLFGFLYWHSLYLVHKFIFSDMVEAIAREAVSANDPEGPTRRRVTLDRDG
ncbi:MAG TPA: DUF2867 domain-containing protein, partial [Thermoanaerobaculia bacterium]